MEMASNLLKLQVEHVMSFDRVSQHLNGMAAVTWLPGIQSTFDQKKRRAHDRTRPACLSLEASEDALTLSLSIAWPRKGKMHFSNYGRWDFRAPISSSGGGDQLCANKIKHRLNAARGIDMLRALLDYGFAKKRNEAVELQQTQWPRGFVVFPHGSETVDESKLDALVSANAPQALAGIYKDQLRHELVDFSTDCVAVDVKIVPDYAVAAAIRQDRFVEDFSPVLGVHEKNPAAFVRNVELRITNNPAAKILARHGIENVEAVSGDHLDQLAVEFAAEINGAFQNPISLPESTIYDALLSPSSYVPVTMSLEQALAEGQTRVVATAMRRAATRRAQKEATDAELFAAAKNPELPLTLNRLGAVQVNTVAALQELPSHYSGSIFTPLDWQPRAVVHQATHTAPVAV